MTMEERPERSISRRNSLAEIDLSELTLDAVMGRIGDLAVDALDGWDAAGATIEMGDKVATYGSPDDRVQAIDQAQYDTGKGPCVDALRSGEVRYFDGTTDEPRWRLFAESAAKAGIYS